MNTSELNNDSNIFPAFVSMHTAPDIQSDIVRNERELGEWYANYDVQRAWFEDGRLLERNHRGQVSELCKADTEDEAYLEMARRARKDESSVFIETADDIRSWLEEYSERDDFVASCEAMIEKLRATR